MKFKNLLVAICGVAMGLASSISSAQFANGADVGWVSQQESSGYSFYNSSGVKTDPFVLLKNLSIIRSACGCGSILAAVGTTAPTCSTKPSAPPRRASAS
ncbi:MAG TPA: hypothetical protein VF670_16230 [Duganella sp.]|jgi:hypothetical protein